LDSLHDTLGTLAGITHERSIIISHIVWVDSMNRKRQERYQKD
jgi:hypothetical protein